MSTTKHTPGPWRVILDDTGGEFSGWPSVEAPEEIDTAIVHRAGFHQRYWGDLSQRECIANARLIAAAPDLLAALKFIVEQIDFPGVSTHTLGNYTHGAGMAMGRAAIAAAEGTR